LELVAGSTLWEPLVYMISDFAIRNRRQSSYKIMSLY